MRRNDIDWLRIGATLLLFPFHAARPFDNAPWHLKSADMSDVFAVFVWFVHQFHMPLFFVLAGWSIERSLRSRTPADVRRERYGRLLVPFLVGVALVSPPQAYVEAITQRGFDGTFLAYLPRFFGSLREFSWHHLWFLIYLFVFTMLYLPLFIRLRRRDSPIAAPRPALLYLGIVPFAVVQLALRWRWPGYQNLYDDWANFAWYSLFFMGGFLLGRSPALEDLVRRERRRCTWVFVLAILGMLPLLAALGDRIVVPGPGYLAYWPLNAAAGVCGVAAILGHGARLAAVDGVGFRYLREAAFPIYILHQTVIVVLGYWVVRMGAPMALRYLMLTASALAVSFAVYHLAIRTAPPLRLAFGMRPRATARGAGDVRMGAVLAAVMMLLLVAPADAARPGCRRACAAARAQCVAQRGAPAFETLEACDRAYNTARRACGRRRACRRAARRERRACAAPARNDPAPCAEDGTLCRACCRSGRDRSACVTPTTSTTIPRQPCAIGNPAGPPSVTFSGTQPGDVTIHGVASNVNTQGLRIVGWAQQDRWYVQPTSAEPFTAISCVDGSFGLTTNPWTRFVLLLVDGGYQVPAGSGIDRHPSIGDGVVAWAEYPGPTDRVTLGTTRFFKKTSNGLATGPGPCPFADANVVQEAAGVVRLRVAPAGGAWSCAEIYGEEPLGYGRYRIKVTGRLDALPRPLVFADFLFRSLTAEVDIECSEALTGVAGRCQAVVQPFHLPDHLRYFDMPAVSETTHEIVWAPASVTFRVWKGHQDEPAAGDVLIEWQYAGADVPAGEGEALLYRVNLWLFGGAAPVDGLEREISVSDFTFTALAESPGLSLSFLSV